MTPNEPHKGRLVLPQLRNERLSFYLLNRLLLVAARLSLEPDLLRLTHFWARLFIDFNLIPWTCLHVCFQSGLSIEVP